MFNTIIGAVGAGAASRYGNGSDQMMRLLAAPAQASHHWLKLQNFNFKQFAKKFSIPYFL
jgi:hypothetical protein